MKKSILNYLLVFVTLMLNMQLVYGQFGTTTPEILDVSNVEIQSRVESVDPAGWLYFKQSALVEPGELFTALKPYTGLNTNDEMTTEKEWTDAYGWSHSRYQQFYQGLEVEDAEYSEHWRDCIVKIAHGKLVEGLNINIVPTISESQALSNALGSIGALEYAWENAQWETGLQEDEEDSTATYYPIGELIIGHVLGKDFIKENYRLCWKFEILAINPYSSNVAYVDAHTGIVSLIKATNQENGPATTFFNGVQMLDTEWRGGVHQNFRLKTNDNGRKIHTKHSGSIINWKFAPNVLDVDDQWGTDHQAETSAHWAATQAWDYFKNTHGNSSIEKIKEVRIWAGGSFGGASWDKKGWKKKIDILNIGRSVIGIPGGPAGDNATLDVVGHEFAHAVINDVAGLDHENEPGALNEAFADIFGFLIERYAEGAVTDWTIREDAAGGANRSIAAPQTINAPALPDRPAAGSPNVYQNTLWYTGAFDKGGIHINSGVQNRWFNILSQGGGQNGVAVSPTGIPIAEEITWYNLYNFMQESSMYADARQGAINAAKILFGPCSYEVIQTTNAWAACGVGTTFSGPCIEVNGPKIICLDLLPIDPSYAAIGTSGASFTWSYPGAWTVITSSNGNNTNNVLTVLDFGTPPPYFPFPVSVTAHSSHGGSETITVILEDCGINPLVPCDGGSGGEKSNGLTISDGQKGKVGQSTINDNSNDLVVYPNPTNQQINIDLSILKSNDAEISIMDINGKLMYRAQHEGSNLFKLDVADYASGVYFIKITSAINTLSRSFVKIQ